MFSEEAAVLTMAGSAYVFAVLLLTNLLSSWEAFADQPHSAESLEQVHVLHHAPPPRSLYRASGSERRYGRAPGDTRPNFVIFFPDGTDLGMHLWLCLGFGLASWLNGVAHDCT